MKCGCDRIIVLDSDVSFASSDGLTYLDLYPESTFDQVDSIVELDANDQIKTEAIIGGSVPATDKNKAILSLRVNPKEQQAPSLKVVAMNGHKTLNVNSLRVVHYDEESFEIEITRDETHWAVCASELRLHTLELEDYELTAEFVAETWDNYSYEEGDIGVYYPLAYYGAIIRETEWIVEDLRPAHSLPFLLKEGFAQCGWEFSSPIFETDIGKRLWVYVLGEDYGQDNLDAWKAVATGVPGKNTVTGALKKEGDDVYRSMFVGIAEYNFTLDIRDEYFSAGIGNQPAWFDLRIYRQVREEDGSTKNILIEKIGMDYPNKDNSEEHSGEFIRVITWNSTLTTVPGDEIIIQVTYMTAEEVDSRSFTYLIEDGSSEPIINNDHIADHKYTLEVTPIRKIPVKGDTLNVADIIDKNLTLMDLLKGTSHLFGRAKLYVNNTNKEIRLYPPFTAKWEDEVIEGFFQYDETFVLDDGIIKDSLEVTGTEITTTRNHTIGYQKWSNPYLKNQDRHVDFDNPKFESGNTDWFNPVFYEVPSRKLVRDTNVRPPMLPEVANNGIEMMYMVDNENDEWTYNIGVVPFIAYGNYYIYGEQVDDEFKYSFFRFEGKWYDTPVSGQKPNFVTLENNEPVEFTPWLIYGEEPLKDLFSIFWRDLFYKESLVNTFSVNVVFNSRQLNKLDYRKLYFIEYAEGFAAWLSKREFNYCTPEGTKLSFIGDVTIEPESIDEDTIPPVVDPCTKVNAPEIEWQIDEDCILSYDQVGTIESNILNEEWLVRYQGESAFEPAPPSPFNPDKNLYLRYIAHTDDEDCSIPPVTVFINVCSVNVLEAEVTYNENTDCYRVDTVLEGCNTYSDIVFELEIGDNREPLTVSNPSDPVEEWYVEVCEPEDDFCVYITPELEEGCDIDPTSVCVNLCPKKEDIECVFNEREGGFNFEPKFNIHKPIKKTTLEYDFDSEFKAPTEIDQSDLLEMVGKIYFRVTLEFNDCPDLVVTCSYERSSQDCGLNTPDFDCEILHDGRLNIIRTGTLVTDAAVDLIRYRGIEQREWQTWDGVPLSACPVYIQRVVIYCNDCPNSCTEIRLCECDISPPPTAAECDSFDVKLLRFSTLLYALPTDFRNDINYIFLKDEVVVQNSSSNIYNGAIEPGSNYIVRALVGACEAQDTFFIESDCIVPEIVYDDYTEYNGEYTITFETDSEGTIAVTHEFEVDATNTQTVHKTPTISNGVVTLNTTLRPGKNTIKATIENECGADDAEVTIDVPCPEVNPGLPKLYTICEGCYGNVNLLDLVEGNPDSNGVWVDVDATGVLYGGTADFSQLPVGTYEFMYVVGEGLCALTTTITIVVIPELSAGINTFRQVCHDSGTINLLDLLSGNPDEGGTWFTEDDIPDLDLDEGTFTPSIDEAEEVYTIAYSHTPKVDKLPEHSECACDSFSVLTIEIEDCTPPPPCPDDSDLGITISEVTNNDPEDDQWDEMLTVSKTGDYENSEIIESDEIYFSYDDGDTWILGDEVKDDDYYEQLRFGFSYGPTSSFDPSPPHYQWNNIRLTSGDDIDMVRLTSGEGTFNELHTDFTSGNNVRAQGSSFDINRQRSFHLQVRHTLNSGWIIQGHYYLFSRVKVDANGIGGPGPLVDTHVRNKVSGKRKILFERRITYNIDCDPTIIEGSFDPQVPDCPTLPANVGMNITDPQGGFEGHVTCRGTVPGQTASMIWQIEYDVPADAINTRKWSCGNPGPSDGLISLNHEYWMVRIIEMGDYCPPFFIERNYQAPTACNVTGHIICRKDEEAGVAWAFRVNNPTVISYDTLQYRINTGPWLSYSNNQNIYVGDEAATVYFRRISNYNNGCPQTTETCNVSFPGVPQPRLSISCSPDNKRININASNLPPGGSYRIYRNGVLFRTQSVAVPVNIDQPGNYYVVYDYTYTSNTIQCGIAPCVPPTLNLQNCTEQDGNIRVNFTSTNLTDTSTLVANITPSAPYDINFNSSTGSGYILVGAHPGQTTDIEVTVDNGCDTATDSITCSMDCISLIIENMQCDYHEGHVTYDIRTSPASSIAPSSNGGYLSNPSHGVYRFRYPSTSGTLTANHPTACETFSRSISCDCVEPNVDITVTCDEETLYIRTVATNMSSLTDEFYYFFIDGIGYAIEHNNNPDFISDIDISGTSHNYTFEYYGCGQKYTQNGSINCSCADPSIVLSANCSGTTVSYSFDVDNEDNVQGNYTIKNNNQTVGTVSKTGAGTYSGTFTVSAGSNNSVSIEAGNRCGGTVKSNTSSANCSCPPSSLSISNLSCNPNNQEITFNINSSNVTNKVLKVNGNTVNITSNPQTVQGTTGNNTIEVTAVDSCSNNNLSDTRNVNCQCQEPSIDLTASCNTSGVISYNFDVTNPSQAQGNFDLLINGTVRDTINNTSASNYSGTYNASPGSSQSVRIRVNNKCGSTTQSNTVNATCGCPQSSLSISDVICNPNTQMLSFNINSSNVTNRVLRVNGAKHNIGSNPQNIQGQVGNNTITVTGEDSCADKDLADSKQINCACVDTPTVSLGSASLSGSTITVPINTTNISSTSQITFIANGTSRSVTKVSNNSFRASFPAISGNNNYNVSVTNSCGDDTDSGSYSYAPCVPPTITKVNEQFRNDGTFRVTFSTTNCESISATPVNRLINPPDCNSTYVEFNLLGGSQPFNYSIVAQGCDGLSSQITGTIDPCGNCGISIRSLGCSTVARSADIVFMVDTSNSISTNRYEAIQETIRKTIDHLNDSSGSFRYAVAEYEDASYLTARWITPVRSGNRFTTYNNVAQDIALGTWNRGNHGCAEWQTIWKELNKEFNAGRLNRRPNTVMHIVVLHDSDNGGCSQYGPYSLRNNFLNDHPNTEISVVRFEDTNVNTNVDVASNMMSAAMATVGGSWGVGSNNCAGYPNNCIDTSNTGDPQNSQLPRRMYYFLHPTETTLTDLVEDISSNCRLTVDEAGCPPFHATNFNWTASNGGTILQDDGWFITTNGVGTYTVSATTQHGCTLSSSYSYGLNYTKKVRTKISAPKVSEPVIKKASQYKYDYSKLTTEDNKELLSLYKDKNYAKIMAFYNKKVESEYFFSCGCDSDEVDKIVKKYLDGLGLL